MTENYFENEFAEFWVEGDILYFVYKPNVVLTLEAAKTIVADRVTVQKGKPYRVFCDLRGLKEANKAARDYLAKEGSHLVEAVAMLIASPVTKIIMNFYLNISRPTTPTKMFTDKAEALVYLFNQEKS